MAQASEALSGDVVPLTEEQQKRVEKYLYLADRSAKKYCKKFNDYDTLLSQAYMGLMKAAVTWNPDKSPNGEDGWNPFAVQHINWYILRLWRIKDDRGLIDFCGVQPINDAEYRWEAKPDVEPVHEAKEEIGKLLKCLTAEQRAVFVMVYHQGMLQKEAADALNTSRQNVQQILETARRKLRRSAWAREQNRHIKKWQGVAWNSGRNTLQLWKAKHEKTFERKRKEGVRRAVLTRKSKQRLSAAMGILIRHLWYLIDHEARTVIGPYRTKQDAMGITKAIMTTHGGAFGWPQISHEQARILDFLYRTGGAFRKQILTDMGLKVTCYNGPMHRLKKLGLVYQAEVGTVRKIGDFKAYRWVLTEKAVSMRRKPITSLRGKDCLDLKEAGYRLLPITPEKGESHAI